jgi:predicted  nucleic acid-binding Zn-ribbon protein
MNIYNLTVHQLKRAATIKEQIERLNKELGSIMGAAAKSRPATTKKRTMSISVRKKIAATQKASWAKLGRAKEATRSAKPAAKKKSISPARRARLSAKLKAYWAAKKKSGKK